MAKTQTTAKATTQAKPTKVATPVKSAPMKKASAASHQKLDLAFDKMLTPTSVKKAMAEVGAGKRDRYTMPVSGLTILPHFNVRVQNEQWRMRVRVIANSIKLEGFKQDKPISVITVVKDGETLVHPYDGHTRLAALALANKELEAEGESPILEVPVQPAPMGTTLEDITANLVTGNNGAPLTPFEIGIVCKRLVGYGQEVEAIAKRFSLTVGYVNDLLLLMGSPKQIRDMVQGDLVSATEAIAALKKYEDRALAHLQAGLARAQAAGKTRLTAKFSPGHIYNRAVKTSAPTMASAIMEIEKDPGFKSLSPELRGKLKELSKVLKDAEKEEARQAAASTQESDVAADAAE